MSEFTARAFDNASDITMAAVQDSIADSLIGPPTHVVGRNPETGNASLLTLEEAGLEADYIPTEDETEYRPYQDGAIANRPEPEESREPEYNEDAEQAVRELVNEQRDEMAQQLANEQLQQPITPEQAEQQMTEVIEQYELGNPEHAEQVGADLAEALGASIEGMQPEQLNDTLVRSALSVGSIYDAWKFNPNFQPQTVTPHFANSFSQNALAGLGMDLRQLPGFDTHGFTIWALNSLWSLAEAFDASGKNPDVNMLNHPQKLVNDYKQFLSFMGVEGEPRPEVAVKFMNGLTKPIVNTWARLQQAPARQGAHRSPRAQSGSRRRSIPGMHTNQDLYDQDALEIYRKEHGRL